MFELISTAMDELAAVCLVTGALDEGSGPATFHVEITAVPTLLLGRKLNLTLGNATVMAIQLPAAPLTMPARFGPTLLDYALLLRQPHYRLTLAQVDEPRAGESLVTRTSGVLLEAMTLDDEGQFFTKLQLHQSRYKDPRLLTLGAKAALGRFTSFAARAAAVTIVAHRLLERDFSAFEPFEDELTDWVLGEGRPLVLEGAQMLAPAGEATWAMIRWTVSLATVCGLLAVYRNDLAEAEFFFEAAVEQTPLVGKAPVAALNLVNACFILGLIQAASGRLEDARRTLEQGVRAYLPCVAAQDVMFNVWVLGDLINVAYSSRLCFISLGLLKLLPPSDVPQMDSLSRLQISQLQSPLGRILKAGRCPPLASFIDSVASRAVG